MSIAMIESLHSGEDGTGTGGTDSGGTDSGSGTDSGGTDSGSGTDSGGTDSGSGSDSGGTDSGDGAVGDSGGTGGDTQLVFCFLFPAMMCNGIQNCPDCVDESYDYCMRSYCRDGTWNLFHIHTLFSS